MPGSINRYAVDFDGDGHIDLQRSVADAIGSVAHYLQVHGWQRGMPTHFEVSRATTKPCCSGRTSWLAQPCCWSPTSSPASLPMWPQFAEQGARTTLDEAGRSHDRARWRWWNCSNGDAAPSLGRGRHAELLRHHALQLVELLRGWR
jgi:membrane-bound lytic murein transglycosylase B